MNCRCWLLHSEFVKSSGRFLTEPNLVIILHITKMLHCTFTSLLVVLKPRGQATQLDVQVDRLVEQYRANYVQQPFLPVVLIYRGVNNEQIAVSGSVVSESGVAASEEQ